MIFMPARTFIDRIMIYTFCIVSVIYKITPLPLHQFYTLAVGLSHGRSWVRIPAGSNQRPSYSINCLPA